MTVKEDAMPLEPLSDEGLPSIEEPPPRRVDDDDDDAEDIVVWEEG